MYIYFFTKLLQGATFRRFWDIIQVIPDSTPDVNISFPRAMANVTSQDFVVKYYIHTCFTATASTDANGVTCEDAQVSTCMYKQTHESTSKYSYGNMCVDACGSTKHVLGYLY